MKILRKNMSSIIKNKFTDNMFIPYTKEQLSFIEEALKNVIENYPISTIDCITYLKKHYKGDLLKAMNEITDEETKNIRFNCVYQSEILKKILKTKEIYGYQVSYKAHNFTTEKSDKLIKESHTSIFVPTIIHDQKCFIILDPGLKLDKPIYFFGNNYNHNHENLKIEIGKTHNKNYPLYLLLDGVNKYSYNKNPHKVYQEFNPNYFTTNPMRILIPSIYKYLYGYRATNFSQDIEKRMSLTIYPIKKTIVIYRAKNDQKISYPYDEIDKNKLLQILPDICKNLNLDLEETIDNILFMKKIENQFLQMMDKKTVKTYLKRKK